MPKLIPVLDKENIARNVANIAKKISADYSNSELVLVGVLNGAFVFMADLIRQLELNTDTVEFLVRHIKTKGPQEVKTCVLYR